MLWVPKRTVSMSPFEHPKHMLKLIGKKIFTVLRSKNLFISKPVMSAHILLNLLNKSNVRLNNIVAQMIYSIWATSQQNLSSGFPTKRDSNQSPQLQRLAKKLKFRSFVAS